MICDLRWVLVTTLNIEIEPSERALARRPLSICTRVHSRLTAHHSRAHSLLKLLTGLDIAAFIAWKLMVNNAIRIAIMPANGNTHQCKFIRYAKSCNH